MKRLKKLTATVLAITSAFSLAKSSNTCFAESVLYSSLYSKDNVDTYYIIGLESDPLSVYPQSKENGVRDFILTEDGQAVYEELMSEHQQIKNSVTELIGRTPEVQYDYTAAFNGFSMALSYNEMLKIKENSKTLGITSVEYGAPTDVILAENESKNDDNTSLSYADLTEKIIEETGVRDSGLDGEGTVIAIIDNEFDVKHEFLSMPDGAKGRLSKSDIKAVYPYLSSAPYVSERCYVNEKIPFAFDYMNYDFNPFSNYDTHGTHVAGIAAGNGDAESDPTYNPDGIASEAQLVLLGSEMLFDSTIIAAYDDALFLGADVINASYGCTYAPTGYCYSEYQAIRNITATGTIFCNAAGNSGKNMSVPQNFTDYSTSGTPTNINGLLAVGSAENPVQTKQKGIIILADGSEEAITDSSDFPITILYDDMEYEYIEIEDNVEITDYETVDVYGKIVLVKESDLTYEQQIANAVSAEAAGIIIYCDKAGEDAVDVGYAEIPAGMVTYEVAQKMIKAEDKTLKFDNKVYALEQNEKVNMSDFSSWAFTEQLILSPDISGFGGNIISSISDEENNHKTYDVMSGTSMSTPQLTGINALLKQYLLQNKEKYGITNRSDYTEISAKLLMSTATPVYTYDLEEIASPRVQGNGIANINSAINTPCYISSDSEKDNYRPKISLGDGYKQSYELTFNITNVSDKECRYTPSLQLFMDTEDENGELSANTRRLTETSDFTVAFSDKEISVPAGETVKATAKIELSDEIYSHIKSNNGRFVDGFVRLSSAETPNLTLSFMAFCGNWSLSDEGGIAYGFAYDAEDTEIDDSMLIDYNQYFAGQNIFDYTYSQPCFSPNGDGVFDSLGLYMFFKRRCYDLTATIYNSAGKQLYTENLGSGYNQESFFGASGSYYDINWDFKENGKIHDGAEYTIEISARLPLSDEMQVIDSCTFKIDNQPPVIKKADRLNILPEPEGQPYTFIIVEAEDNVQLQGAVSYSDIYPTAGDGQSANCSVSGNKIIVDTIYLSDNDIIQVYDTAGNYTEISVGDYDNDLTLECTDDFGFATTDEETFGGSRLFITDENNQIVDIDIQLSETPAEIYEECGSEDSSTLFIIDGFITTYVPVTAGLYGDANIDCEFNVRDAAYVARMLCNTTTSEYEEFITSIGGYCADCNKDGTVTVRDAAKMARELAEKIS
ncbi:MAG: S8 family serine peptidase [Oscillospiraceae bacterium]|nr:S8 family serine peptidase [Oscillospiraceae bacterium]